jgi:Bacterial Ig domain
MKQIFTLFVLGVLCLFTTKTFSQITQGFEPISNSSPLPSLTSNCWSFSGTGWDNNSKVTSTGSLVVVPTTSSSSNLTSNNGQIITPAIDFQTSNSISLKYELSNKLATQADRTITLSLWSHDGVKTFLTSVSLNTNTNAKQVLTLNYTLAVVNPGTQRLMIDINGNGDGNSYMYLDDLSISQGSATAQPAFHYSPSNCNSAPIAVSNTYNALSNTSVYTGSSVLNNDSDPNNEALTAKVATQSLDGIVVMNSDGTFTFTPNAGFIGSFTSFTYTVTDAGYDRMSSTATVNIYFPQVTTLPLQLLHFSGTAGTKTNLSWTVASNQTGSFFEVERSTNGKTFESIASIFTTEKSGEETYQYADAAPVQTTCYRLRLVNRDGSSFYSTILSFRTAAAVATITLLQNPVQNTLRFSVPQSATITGIRIYNTSGVVLQAEKISSQKNNIMVSVPLHANLTPAMYVLEVLTSMGSVTTQFIKQ